MKIRILILLLLILVTPLIFNLIINKQKLKSTLVSCPSQATATLNINHVKPLELNSTMTQVFGLVTNSENVGYIFQAKSGQKFFYDRSDDICFWVYRPDNKLLTESVIPINGSYIIQIASPYKEKKSFNLNLGLNVVNSQYRDYLKNQYGQDNISPKAFAINYYQKINQGRYQETWSSLAPSFQEVIRGGYNEYQQWWETVEEVKIGRVETTEQTENTATVNIELWYLYKSGKEVYDQSKYLYLIWDQQRTTWLIEAKKAS